MATAFFSTDPGAGTARIQPDRVTAPEGSWVLALGGDHDEHHATLDVGDFVEWGQLVSRSSNTLVSVRVQIKGPARMPAVSGPAPLALGDGETVTVFEDGTLRTVTLDTADFASIGAATELELAAVLARDLPTLRVRVGQDTVVVESVQSGQQAQVTAGGTAAAGFRHPRWRFHVLVDGVSVTDRLVRPGDDRDLVDVALPLAATLPIASFAWRLELEDSDGVTSPMGAVSIPVPGVYVDDVSFSAFTGVALRNRDPEPGETIRVDDPIRLDVVSNPFPVDASTVQVFVTVGDDPEELALDAGVFQSGWDGPESGVIDNVYQVRVTVDPTSALPPETPVTVRVVAEDADGTPIDSSYDLTTADTDPPGILDAFGTGTRTIRVVFDEPVMDVDDPTKWTVTAVETPSMPVEVVSVEVLSSTVIQLHLDTDTSVGRPYLVAVDNLDDLTGNNSGPLEVTVEGYRSPRWPADRSFSIRRFIPDINKVDRDVTGELGRFVECLQDVVDLLLSDTDDWPCITDPDSAPESFVDAMLASLGNPFPFDLDLLAKRRLIRVMIDIYQLQGTAAGIIAAVTFFLEITVSITALNVGQSWILGVSQLGVDSVLGTTDVATARTFDVVSPVALTDSQRETIRQIVSIMKPANTHHRLTIEP